MALALQPQKGMTLLLLSMVFCKFVEATDFHAVEIWRTEVRETVENPRPVGEPLPKEFSVHQRIINLGGGEAFDIYVREGFGGHSGSNAKTLSVISANTTERHWIGLVWRSRQRMLGKANVHVTNQGSQCDLFDAENKKIGIIEETFESSHFRKRCRYLIKDINGNILADTGPLGPKSGLIDFKTGNGDSVSKFRRMSVRMGTDNWDVQLGVSSSVVQPAASAFFPVFKTIIDDERFPGRDF